MKKTILDDILGIICNVFEAYSIVLIVKSKAGFRIVSSFSLGENIDIDSEITPGFGLTGWILKEHQALILNNFDQQKDCIGYYKDDTENEIKSFMGCPLPKQLGALCLDSKKQYSFSTKDQKIFQQFANLLTETLTNLSHYGKLRTYAHYRYVFQALLALRKKIIRWEPFLENFLNTLSAGSGFSTVFLTARDPQKNIAWLEGVNSKSDLQISAGDTLNIDFGLIGWIFKNNTPVFLEENKNSNSQGSLFGSKIITPDYTSIICLPLTVGGSPRMILTLADLDEIKISTDIRYFCEMVMDYFSLHLENLYLKNLLNSTPTMQIINAQKQPPTLNKG